MPTDSAGFYRPDGSWSCVRDHVTEPCGDCAGCRLVVAENAAEDANWQALRDEAYR